MTYYADSGEFVFEFDTSECESYPQTTYTCFTDTAAQADQFGHWDVLWNDASTSTTDCYPGKSGCGGDADNILDLTQDGGGVFEISKNFGTGSNVALVFDETANAWAVAGIGASAGGTASYEVARSLRFERGDSAYLARTAGSPTNSNKFSFSCWVKRTQLSTSSLTCLLYTSPSPRD